jgi:hypothetical protein
LVTDRALDGLIDLAERMRMSVPELVVGRGQ